MSAPVAMTVTRWKCPHCSRARAKKSATVEHIARCWHNPELRGCWTCAHFSYPTSADIPDPCIPGQPCDCYDSPAGCEAGAAVPDDGTPVMGCPLWEMAS
jgi:hypothetical protein